MDALVSTPTEDRYVKVRNLRFHYRVVGDPSNPPVVVLHGIMGHAREWDVLVGVLAATHRVFAVDQRGHGESDWVEEYTASVMADDLLALVEALDLRRPSVIGHSMGAMAAMLAAARRPEMVGRLVVIDIGPDSVSSELAHQLRQFVQSLAAASYGSVDEALAVWTGDPLIQPRLLRHYVEHGLVADADGRYAWRFDGLGLMQFFDGVGEHELWDAVDHIECPVLVVRGEHSPILSVETASEMVRRLSDGRLAVIPNGSHDLGVQQPEAVGDAAARFL